MLSDNLQLRSVDHVITTPKYGGVRFIEKKGGDMHGHRLAKLGISHSLEEMALSGSTTPRDDRNRTKPGAARMSVILIVANPLLREGLTRVLERTRFRIVKSGNSLRTLAPLPEGAPDLVLIGAEEEPAATVRELEICRERYPSARRVVFEEHSDRNQSAMMIEAGVSAYFGRAVTIESFLKSLELVMLGATVFSSPIKPFAVSHDRSEEKDSVAITASANISGIDQTSHRLSKREVAILRCLVQGDSNKIIARRFQIAEGTVKVHIKAILRKIQVANRTQAAIWAMSHLAPASAEAGLAPEQPTPGYCAVSTGSVTAIEIR
jgi:two-component system nitrate/nitrite response regulator NarL